MPTHEPGLIDFVAEHVSQRALQADAPRCDGGGSRAPPVVDATCANAFADRDRCRRTTTPWWAIASPTYLRVAHFEDAPSVAMRAAVADLSALLGVKRRAVEHRAAPSSPARRRVDRASVDAGSPRPCPSPSSPS